MIENINKDNFFYFIGVSLSLNKNYSPDSVTPEQHKLLEMSKEWLQSILERERLLEKLKETSKCDEFPNVIGNRPLNKNPKPLSSTLQNSLSNPNLPISTTNKITGTETAFNHCQEEDFIDYATKSNLNGMDLRSGSTNSLASSNDGRHYQHYSSPVEQQLNAVKNADLLAYNQQQYSLQQKSLQTDYNGAYNNGSMNNQLYQYHPYSSSSLSNGNQNQHYLQNMKLNR